MIYKLNIITKVKNMKNLVIVSFPAKEGMLENLKQSMKEALPDTRNFDGCISVDTYIEDSTNTIHLIEDWESLEHQSKYLNWRVETGLFTALDPILDGGAQSIKVVLCGQKYSAFPGLHDVQHLQHLLQRWHLEHQSTPESHGQSCAAGD